MNTAITLLLFVVALLGLHFGLGVAAWLAAVLAFVVAVAGVLVVVLVRGGGPR